MGTTLGRLLEDIEANADSGTIDLGFMLLTLNEDTFNGANTGIGEIAARARRDGKTHDITIGLGVGGTGFTIHCNEHPVPVAAPSLQRHCERRKYTEKATSWFGVCLHPSDMSMRFGLSLEYSWKHDPVMEELTEGLAKPITIANAVSALRNQVKAGRNDPCPCGSGRKYKKCCLLI
ncbi:MAG: SEC-C metal-binding domain-containing protein [Sulfuriferula sp.]